VDAVFHDLTSHTAVNSSNVSIARAASRLDVA
jgi:hypothetical protein